VYESSRLAVWTVSVLAHPASTVSVSAAKVIFLKIFLLLVTNGTMMHSAGRARPDQPGRF
jgi:uncharacterized membrane protein